METTTEFTTEVGYCSDLQAVQASLDTTNVLLTSINTYLFGALILLVCIFVYKFLTMFTGT